MLSNLFLGINRGPKRIEWMGLFASIPDPWLVPVLH